MKKNRFAFLLLPAVFLLAAANSQSSEFHEEPEAASESIPSASLLIQLETDPGNQALRLQLARAYIGERDYIPAVSECISILKSNSSCAEAHYLIAKSLRPLRGNPKKCLEHAREAVRLDDNPIYQKELFNTLYSMKHYQEALELGNQLAGQVNDLSIRYNMAVIHLRLGQREEMREILDAIIKEEPDFAPALVLRASDNIDYQNYPEALPDLDRALTANPRQITAHYLRGRAAYAMEDYACAQTEFEFVVDADPFHYHALFQLARTYTALNRKNDAGMVKKSLEAVKDYSEEERERWRAYLQTHPDTAEIHWRMACVYLEIQRGNLAAKELDRVLELEPDHSDALMTLANIYMGSQEYEKALPYLSRARDCHPDQDSVLFITAFALHRLERNEEAISVLKQVLSDDPSHTKANELLKKISR